MTARPTPVQSVDPTPAVAASTTAAEPGASGTEGAPHLLGIGAAAVRAGISERALRYYQELGLITPSGTTQGGLRRYSESDLARVARIRELQTLLGFNLDEIAAVLRNEDRISDLRIVFRDEHSSVGDRRSITRECLALQEELRLAVEAKRAALTTFLVDLDERIGRLRRILQDEVDNKPKTPPRSRRNRSVAAK